MIVPAESDPELSDRFVQEHQRFLASAHAPWGPHQARSLARQRANGSLTALLWKEEGGKALGLAWVPTLRSELRVAGLWLVPTGPDVLATFLNDLEADRHRHVATMTDVLPGFTDENQSTFFAPRGFWHRAKVLMRRDSAVATTTVLHPSEIRPIQVTDLKAVVRVYVRAYSERPNEFWTWGVANAWAEAEQDVMGHLNRAGGWAQEFLPDASFVWEEKGKVLGAVLVEVGRNGVPYVEDLVVEPESHRHGIGRSLLESSLDHLTRKGPQAVELAAIRHGAPFRLYSKLGFVEVPPPHGRLDGHWVRGRSPV